MLFFFKNLQFRFPVTAEICIATEMKSHPPWLGLLVVGGEVVVRGDELMSYHGTCLSHYHCACHNCTSDAHSRLGAESLLGIPFSLWHP